MFISSFIFLLLLFMLFVYLPETSTQQYVFGRGTCWGTNLSNYLLVLVTLAAPQLVLTPFVRNRGSRSSTPLSS